MFLGHFPSNRRFIQFEFMIQNFLLWNISTRSVPKMFAYVLGGI